MTSHYNIIANVLQYSTYESVGRKQTDMDTLNIAGILPFSYSLALVMIVYSNPFRGDDVIVLPKFDFVPLLNSIQRYKIDLLIVVSILGPVRMCFAVLYLARSSLLLSACCGVGTLEKRSTLAA